MKKQISIDPANKQKTLGTYFQYYRLSSLLFDNQKTEIYNVSDIPEDNSFFSMAQQKAIELEIDWFSMSHEDSNRIMLAMLEDCWNHIRDIENAKNLTLEITLKFLK